MKPVRSFPSLAKDVPVGLRTPFPKRGSTSLGFVFPVIQQKRRIVDSTSSLELTVDARDQTSKLHDLLAHLERELQITQPDDWYSIKISDMREVAKLPPRFTKKDLAEALSKKYPQFEWDMVRLLSGKQARQKLMERVLRALFQKEEMLLNVRKEGGLVNLLSGSYLELDVYIPSLKLAFEYQDPHHYISAGYTSEPLEAWKMRDEQKHRLASAQGITIIPVPCWWDGKEASLTATIKKVNPQLLPHKEVTAEPIPEEPPENFFDQHKLYVPGVGEPSLASFLTSSSNPIGWWLFEKYDGIRGFWNPEHKRFYSRHGKVLRMPPEIIAQMPNDIMLDGEIWFGRDNYGEVVKVAQRVDSRKIDWTKFKYMVYDVPNHKGMYRERYNILKEHVDSKCPEFIQLAPYQICKGKEHLEEVFLDIIDNKGEGIILRLPHSILKGGRRGDYQKFKTYRDAEAKIIACPAPNLWECMLPNGIKFLAGPATNSLTRKWQLKVGDIVTFLHHGFYSGNQMPQRPRVYRPRPEYTWEEVVAAWERDERKDKEKGAYLRKRLKGSNRKEKGHWTSLQNIREFFDNYARNKGFDPSDIHSWKKVSTRNIRAIKGGHSLLNHYKHSLTKALTDAYPELTFPNLKEKKPRNYWSEQGNVRAFLDEFALEKGFDPQSLDNWNNITKQQLLEKKGGITIFEGHFQGSKAKMLRAAYPELAIPVGYFKERRPKKFWKDVSRCREFFDNIAKEISLDTSQPENWYQVPLKQFNSKPGASTLIKYYGNNWLKALQAAYPELQFPSPIKEP